MGRLGVLLLLHEQEGCDEPQDLSLIHMLGSLAQGEDALLSGQATCLISWTQRSTGTSLPTSFFPELESTAPGAEDPCILLPVTPVAPLKVSATLLAPASPACDAQCSWPPSSGRGRDLASTLNADSGVLVGSFLHDKPHRGSVGFQSSQIHHHPLG